jgi:hypothetical protein
MFSVSRTYRPLGSLPGSYQIKQGEGTDKAKNKKKEITDSSINEKWALLQCAHFFSA